MPKKIQAQYFKNIVIDHVDHWIILLINYIYYCSKTKLCDLTHEMIKVVLDFVDRRQYVCFNEIVQELVPGVKKINKVCVCLQQKLSLHNH